MGTIEREPEVIDNLTSTSTIDALSAKQGKVLNDKIVGYNFDNTSAVNLTGTSSKFEVYNSDVVASRYLIRGKTCFLTVVLHCITPVSSSEAVCSAPEIASSMGRSINFLLRNYYNPSQTLSGLIQNGLMYVVGGVAGADYGVTIAYPVD